MADLWSNDHPMGGFSYTRLLREAIKFVARRAEKFISDPFL